MAISPHNTVAFSLPCVASHPIPLSLVMQNEAMTGVFTFDPVFSRLSLAVMEDSGWYSVNYSSASPLLWGRGKGWSFVEEGCGNLVEDTHDE